MTDERVPILLEEKLMLAPYWMPVRSGWMNGAEEQIELHDSITPAAVRERPAIALVDALIASRLLDDHLIIRDHGAVWSRSSLLTMVTSERPDGIEAVTACTPGVSVAGRAIAEVVIPEFYGITIVGWTDEPRPVDRNTILINEGPAALLPTEDERHYHEDLGRAWFLMTDKPFASHLCVASASVVEHDPDAILAGLDTLDQLLASSDDHRREVRRNISRDHGIDRDLVTDILAEMSFQVDDATLSGLETLYTRAGVRVPGGVRALWRREISSS